MNIVRDQIRQQIDILLSDKKLEVNNYQVEIPKDRSVGDYAANVSFLLVKQLKKAPNQIAEELSTDLIPYFKDTVMDGIQIIPLRGFINFILPRAFCYQHISQADFSQRIIESDEYVLLEYVSANPTGPLHIGHGRWAALGDSLRRILSWAGYKVSTEFYINDAGSQINNLRKSVEALKHNQPIPEDGYHGAYVKELVNASDPVLELIAHQQSVLKRFRVEFDTWFTEKKELHDSGLVVDALKVLEGKGYTYKDAGALFFRTTDFGDDKDRVLIKENGDYTYFAADIAYHYNKVQRGFNRLVNIWGADHHGYIKRVQAGLKAMVGDSAKLDVLLGQLVTLYRDGVEIRMSKRTGDMIELEEIIEETGIDAPRFFLALKSADTHLDVDLELAKKQSNDNPVFYVQYAHARIASIIRKSDYQPSFHPEIDLEQVELKLLKFILSFEDDVYIAAKRMEPHRIANYLLDLANLFHSFYHVCKVNVDDKAVAENRLALISQVKKVLSIGLDLLGVIAPESM